MVSCARSVDQHSQREEIEMTAISTRFWVAALVTAALVLAVRRPASAQVKVDPKLPVYKAAPGVSGNLKSVGSDSMVKLVTFWNNGFQKFYPGVVTELEGKGSSTAPAALIAGTATFGPMSRKMKADEIGRFQAKFGYKPVELATSIDMLAIFVNKDNPLKGLTLPQVDAIFSPTRRLGHAKDIVNWGDVGLGGIFANKTISKYGRNSASGTYGYFKEHALGGGDFKNGVKEMPGSSAVVQGVASDKFGIGYSGVAYLTADVRTVPLASSAGEDFVPVTPDYAYSGEYPLSRFLNLAVNYKPGTKLDPLRAEYIKYIFSQQGQQDVLREGYYCVTAEIAREQLKLVGLKPDF